MRIIVLSDSHGNYNALEKVVSSNQDADLFLFLGDGLLEFEDLEAVYPQKEFWSVSGNCDLHSMKKSTETAWIRGVKLLYTHGHEWRVKKGLDDLRAKAREAEAQLVLFGHTHTPFYLYEDGIHYFNPGSVALPRCGVGGSYGLIELDGKNIVCNHVKVR